MKKKLIFFLCMFIAASTCAYAQQSTDWLTKNHQNFKMGMIIFGALAVLLVIWEVSYQISAASGKGTDLQVSIVGEQQEEEGEDPLKKLLTAQTETERQEKLTGEQEDEGMLPSFLEEDLKDSEKLQSEAPGAAPTTESEDQETDPFKMLLKRTESEEEEKEPEKKPRPPDYSLTQAEPKQVERSDEDPFKALLRSMGDTAEDTTKKEEPRLKRRSIKIEPPSSTTRKPEEQVAHKAPSEVQREQPADQQQVETPQKEEQTKTTPEPGSQKLKMDVPGGRSKVFKLPRRSAPKHKGARRLFARFSKKDEQKETEMKLQEENLEPPVSADDLEQAILTQEARKKSKPQSDTPDQEKVVLRMPGEEGVSGKSSGSRKRLSLDLPLKKGKEKESGKTPSQTPKTTSKPDKPGPRKKVGPPELKLRIHRKKKPGENE